MNVWWFAFHQNALIPFIFTFTRLKNFIMTVILVGVLYLTSKSQSEGKCHV